VRFDIPLDDITVANCECSKGARQTTRCKVPIVVNGTKIYRGLAVCLLLLAVDYSLLTQPLCGFDRNNVPLKNWGGFSVNRGWIYDALEKVALAGLADRVLLNTKPLSRVEVARVVAQAVQRIKAEQGGDYNHRGHLEELVYQLVEEFGSELNEMGVRTPLNREESPGFVRIKPIRHVQFGSVFTDGPQKLVNDFARNVSSGGNPSSTLDGRIQIGDFLSFYYQPEFSANGSDYQARLQSGYGKLTFWNAELLVGRESLWWGPGFRGSMTLSNNGFPLDQVRLSSAEPFRLPWIFKYLGPINLTGFAGRLDDKRNVANAMLGGWRINFAPSRHLEFGFSRVFQFGGDGRPSVTPLDFLRLLVGQGSDDPKSALNVNNILSLDFTLRLPNVGRYIRVAKDLSIYGELGWDDTTDPGFEFLFIPTGAIIPRKPGGILGFLLTGFLGDPKLDFRLELAKTTDIQFTHGFYTSGFVNGRSVISHFIGTDGHEIFTRFSRRFSPNLLLGLQLSRAQIGSTEAKFRGSEKEERNTLGIDLSYRFSNGYSVFLKYGLSRVENRDFVPSDAEYDNLFRIEFTRKFGK